MEAPKPLEILLKPDPKIYKKLLSFYRKNMLLRRIQRRILKILFPKCLVIEIMNQTEYEQGQYKTIEVQDAQVLSYGPYWCKNKPKYLGVRIYYE